jgi:hypothetical protein
METLEQRLQKLVPGRPAPAAAPAPGTAATKTVLNKPGARPDLKYTPSPMDTKVREIENAIGRFVPDFIKDFGREQEQKGFAEALLPGAVMNAPGLGGLLPRAVAGGATELIAPIAVPGKQTALQKPRFADLRGSATPGSMTPATDNSAADKAFADAAKFQAERSTGTDTGSGDREVARVAQTDNMDDNMKAWAAANPELAANLVKKVDERRMNSPEYTQVGYDQAKKQVDPSYDPSVRSQNFGPVANGEVYGRNLALQGTAGVGPVADGALYADMISGKEKPNADKASDFLNNYKAQLSANLEPFAETVIPSQSQNPVTFGGDGTPIDSELQVGKAIVDFKGDLNKNISNSFRAF